MLSRIVQSLLLSLLVGTCQAFQQIAPLTRPTTSLHSSRVVILGGGFGGLNTALTLHSLPWTSSSPRPKIVLVDKKERFVFLPLLYELCVGDASLEEVAPTYRDLLKDCPDIEFVKGDVSGIDVDKNAVYLNVDGECCMNYDALVVATGMQPSLAGVEGAEEYALPFYGIEDCYELRKKLNVLDEVPDETINVVIVGGGYSGVELALNMAERLNNASVTLVHRGDEIMLGSTDYNRQTAIKKLNAKGIDVLTRSSVDKVAPTENESNPFLPSCQITLRDKTSDGTTTRNVTAHLLLWTAGAKPPTGGALNSRLSRDTTGRILTSPNLCAKNTDNIFVIGDASRAKKNNYPATAQVAMQQATTAAWNVYATLEKEKLLPFRFVELGEMMSLGSEDASITSLGGRFRWSGEVASLARRLVYGVRMPTGTQAVKALGLGVEGKIERKLQNKIRNIK